MVSMDNPIVAIPKLLEWLNRKRVTLTIDAMWCVQEIADTILQAQGHVVLALKENPPALDEAVKNLRNEASLQPFKEVRHDGLEETPGDHGPVETWRGWVCDEVKWLKRLDPWPGVRPRVRVESRPEQKGPASTERR